MLSLKSRAQKPAATTTRVAVLRDEALELLTLTGTQKIVLNDRWLVFLAGVEMYAADHFDDDSPDVRFSARAVAAIAEDAGRQIAGEVTSASRAQDVLLDLMKHMPELPA